MSVTYTKHRKNFSLCFLVGIALGNYRALFKMEKEEIENMIYSFHIFDFDCMSNNKNDKKRLFQKSFFKFFVQIVK